MNKSNYKLNIFLLAGMALLSACQKEIDLPGIANDPVVYMPQAARGNPFIPIEVVGREPGQQDTIYYRPYSAYLEGQSAATQDIQVEFAVDQRKLDSLNQLETTAGRPVYELLPPAAYVTGNMLATIKQGERISEIRQFGVNPRFLREEGKYLLPISIKSASGSLSLKDNLKTTYYQVNLTVPDFVSGNYVATGVRNGSDYGTDPSRVRKTVTRVAKNVYECNLIANLGPWCCSNKFSLRVNADNTVTVSGHLEDPGNLLTNSVGTTSTFDPLTNTFVLHYEYNYYGFVAKMSETLKKI